MRTFEIVLALLAAIVALVTLARRLAIPDAIPLLVGGVLLGQLPGLPRFSPDPALVFVLFVPPLVFSSAFATSWRDFRVNRGPIARLAVGLVLMTTVIVAVIAHRLIPGMTWAVAFVLGAVVSSTDTVAAMAIAERVGLPQRLVTVLEGEGMMNDAVGLVAYRFAVAAVVTGGFSFLTAGGQFVAVCLGGVAVGLAIGWLDIWLFEHIADGPTTITISLLAPYAAYLPADHLGFSGVLAVVVAALYIGYRDSHIASAATRIEATAVWQTMVFVLNGLIFLLLGLQLRDVRAAVSAQPVARLAIDAAIVVAVVVIVRILWVFLITYLPRLLSRRLRQRDPSPQWQAAAVLAWTGIRGADTLVIALALPLTTATGAPFPERGEVIFLAFAVIVATLVVQGLGLPAVIRLVGLHDDGVADREVAKAHLAVAHAALRRLDELEDVDGVLPAHVQKLRMIHEKRARRYRARYDGRPDRAAEVHADTVLRLRREVLIAQREALVELRDREVIGDNARQEVQRDLDLEESELG